MWLAMSFLILSISIISSPALIEILAFLGAGFAWAAAGSDATAAGAATAVFLFGK